MKGVGRLTRQGMLWNFASSVASNFVKLAVFAALGRLLDKRDFGVVAAAWTVVQLGNVVKDLGVGLALVQRKSLDQEHVEAAFTFSVLLGIGLGAFFFFCAGPIGRLYGIPDSIPIIRLLSVLFVLRGFALVPGFMCRRGMQFRALAIADFCGYMSGSALAVGLAVSGAGAWSIAWGYVLETGVNVTILLFLAPPPPRLRWNGRHMRDLLGFGIGQSIGEIASYFANQGDYMVVGRFLGAEQLGVYQRAYELVRFPATVFSTIAGSVLFSAFSKVQDDTERSARAFRRSMFAAALVLLPASAGLIVLAPEVIHLLLGPKWSDVVWPFRIMALVMFARTMYKLGAIIGRSAGDVVAIAAWHILYAVLVIGGALISKQWGVLGVSCTTGFAILVTFAGLTGLARRVTRLPFGDLLRAHLPGLGLAILVGGLAWADAAGLRALGLPYAVVAAGVSIAGALMFLAVTVLKTRGTSDHDWPWLRDIVSKIGSRK
ncbi:MAG TPA: lipopolysaccharide biosynthesis protein [Kofleriaceae bacterium]|jgi:PST family polysaccharide transporter